MSPATKHPFRFGLQALEWPVAGDPTSIRVQLQQQARRAEAVGFDVLTVADHLMPIIPPLVSVQCAAEVTTRLRFGTFVLNNDFRHPAMLARDAAATHLLCDGRLELGLGAGHNKAEYDAIGLAFEPGRTRVERLEESVAIIRRLLDGESVTHTGAHYQLQNANTFVPAAPLRLPLLVGGNGRRVLSLAARQADIVGLTGLTRSIDNGHIHKADWSERYLESRLAIVHDAAVARPVAAPQLEFNALVQRVVKTDDRRSAAQQFCDDIRAIGVDLPIEHALNTPFLLFGTAAQIADHLHAARERWGITYFTTRAVSIDTMADVIALLR